MQIHLEPFDRLPLSHFVSICISAYVCPSLSSSYSYMSCHSTTTLSHVQVIYWYMLQILLFTSSPTTFTSMPSLSNNFSLPCFSSLPPTHSHHLSTTHSTTYPLYCSPLYPIFFPLPHTYPYIPFLMPSTISSPLTLFFLCYRRFTGTWP